MVAKAEVSTGADGVTWRTEGHVAVITLDRPHRRWIGSSELYARMENPRCNCGDCASGRPRGPEQPRLSR